jgi:hypothetical protein
LSCLGPCFARVSDGEAKYQADINNFSGPDRRAVVTYALTSSQPQGYFAMARNPFRQRIFLALTVLLFAHVAAAEVNVRIDARPRSGPIEAYVLATGDDGPIIDLVAADFVVTVDGAAIEPFNLTLPPRQDPAQKLSIVIMARTGLGGPYPVVDVEVYEAFVKQLVPGDFAAVVLLGYGAGEDSIRDAKVSVLPFRQIDGGAHTQQIVDFLNTSQSSLAREFTDFAWPLLAERGLDHALDQFERHAFRLPNGPRAIVTWSITTLRLEESVARANRNGISLFTRHLAGLHTSPEYYMAQQSLADNTGGVVVEVPPDSGSAMPAVTSWLKDGYRLTIPTTVVDDCGLHMLEITVRGMTSIAPFARCDAIPDAIEFPPQEGVSGGATIISEARRVRGIGSPAPVSVVRGEYSLGCTQTFTTEAGYIQPGQAICIRQRAASRPGARAATRLIIGGVTSRFESYVAP